jgi:hypothetical protein
MTRARTWRRRWFIQIVFIAGIVCASEARAMTIIGTLYKTYADRPNTPAAGFSVKICDQYGSCPAQGQTDSGGSFSFQGPLQPRYYSLYAWNDADLWGSQYVSEYQPTFVLTSPVDNGGTVNLGRVITSPRPLVPQAVKPLNNGAAFPSPCTTTFNWTDGLDSMRRSTKWPVNYQMTLVQPNGWAFTYSVNTPSLSLNLPIPGGSYLWYVVARLGVAQSPPGNWIYLETRSPNFSLWVPYSAGDCSSPIDDAQFVSQTTPPATLLPGQQASVSVTMKNTGTSTWTEAGGYFRLGSQNPQDNAIWGLGRVFLAPGESITPGQQKSFSFNATAPSAPGTYNFQWRMVHEMIRWFGAFTPNAPVSVSGPDSQPPVVTWISPANGSTVSGVVTLAVNATDNVRVSKVEMYANGYRLTPTYTDCSQIPGATAILDPPYRLCADTSNGSVDGTYTLTAKAYDDAGNVGNSAPITITVSNPGCLHPPTGLRYEGFPSRNILWNPPDNATGADQVHYDLWLFGPSCPSGCEIAPGAPSWYTIGPSVQGGTYTWRLQAISNSRCYSGPVDGPSFVLTQLDLYINRTTFHTTDTDWTIQTNSTLVGYGVTLIEEFWNGSYWQEDWRGGIGQIPSSGVLTFVGGAPYFAGSFRSHVEAAGSSSGYVYYSLTP